MPADEDDQPTNSTGLDAGEAVKQKRFREFWMGKVLEGFGADLEVVRKVRIHYLAVALSSLVRTLTTALLSLYRSPPSHRLV